MTSNNLWKKVKKKKKKEKKKKKKEKKKKKKEKKRKKRKKKKKEKIEKEGEGCVGTNRYEGLYRLSGTEGDEAEKGLH